MTEKKQNELAKKIKIYMLTHNISQRKLAKKLNVTPQAISSLLTGKNETTIKTINSITKALGVPSNYFFADESTNQTITGNHNNIGVSGKDFELINSKIDVIQKTLENFDLRLKFLEKK